MRLLSRAAKLERLLVQMNSGRCRQCHGRPETVVIRKNEVGSYPDPCPACGWRPFVVVVRRLLPPLGPPPAEEPEPESE